MPSLESKLFRLVLLVALLPSAVAWGTVFLLRGAQVLDPSHTLLLGGVLHLALVGYTLHAAWGWLRAALEPLGEVRRGAELAARAHLQHRLAEGTGDELELLAQDINRLADRAQTREAHVDREVARIAERLDDERRRLALVVANLREGVVLLAPSGEVSLTNPAAQRMLGPLPLRTRLADQEPELTPAIARAGAAGLGAAEQIVLSRGGREIQATVTTWRDADGVAEGVLLVLRPGEGVAAAVPAPPEGARPILYDFSVLEAATPMLPPEVRARALSELTFAILDCETTGLDPDGGDRIVSLGVVRLRRGTLRTDETFQSLVHPGRPIPVSSTRIHGLTDAEVAGAPPLEEVLPAFLRFVEGAVLVGHDVWFDLHFLRRGTEALGRPALARGHAVLDTRLLGELVHGRIGNSLEQMAERLGVPMERRHSALGDALTTGRILERLLPLLARREMATLECLLAAQDRLRHAVR